MGNTLIREMVIQDIPDALRLCRAAGWNHLHVDWLRLIDHQPGGCFAAEIDGRLVGTVTSIRYQTQLAWIGMMLVDQNYRRRGIGTKLMNAILNFLREQKVECIKLDATPLGEPVYARLGFRSESSFHRWERRADETGKAKRSETVAMLNDFHLKLDREAFGVDRSAWLQRVAQSATVVTHNTGFGMIRPGHIADYLGPVTAETPEAALAIVQDLLNHPLGQRLFWDLPHDDDDLCQLPLSLGFHPVRDLTRMWTGKMCHTSKANLQFAIIDPSVG